MVHRRKLFRRFASLFLAALLAITFLIASPTRQASANTDYLNGAVCSYINGWCSVVADVPSPFFGWQLTVVYYTYKQGISRYSVESVNCGSNHVCATHHWIDSQTILQYVTVDTTLTHDWAYVSPFI